MDRFKRFVDLVNINNFEKISNQTILIVGIGGVGGYALESLVRLGIKNIIIIDHDIIDITNLNRQILSLNNNIGQKKVEVAKNRVLNINPQLNLIDLPIFLNQDNIHILNQYSIDYIIDACDTVSTKINLIDYALNKQIKIISAMGTGKRVDASKLTISTLNKTYNDPLAKVMRHELKKRNISLNIPVIFSHELPLASNCKTIPSCSYVPAVAGLLITNYIVNDILKI